jgi:hypothetical protein
MYSVCLIWHNGNGLLVYRYDTRAAARRAVARQHRYRSLFWRFRCTCTCLPVLLLHTILQEPEPTCCMMAVRAARADCKRAHRVPRPREAPHLTVICDPPCLRSVDSDMRRTRVRPRRASRPPVPGLLKHAAQARSVPPRLSGSAGAPHAPRAAIFHSSSRPLPFGDSYPSTPASPVVLQTAPPPLPPLTSTSPGAAWHRYSEAHPLRRQLLRREL